MKPRFSIPWHCQRRGPADQRGVVLLISLIILAVLLAAGAALVRSFDTSLFQAGNLAFKRDLANQAERVTPVVLASFQAGTLSTPAARGANAAGYSATMLPSNAQGIPNDLLSAAPTVAPAVINVADQGVTIRYLVDRMCLVTGDETALGDRCVGVDYSERGGSVAGGSVSPLRQVNYRVSIRVDGPRNTQAFFQSTLSL